MEQFYIHDAIRNLYPNVVTIMGEQSFDIDNILLEIDMDAVNIEAEKLSQIKPVNLNDIIQELSKKLTELENIVATK